MAWLTTKQDHFSRLRIIFFKDFTALNNTGQILKKEIRVVKDIQS